MNRVLTFMAGRAVTHDDLLSEYLLCLIMVLQHLVRDPLVCAWWSISGAAKKLFPPLIVP